MQYQILDSVILVAFILAFLLSILAVALYFGFRINAIKAELSGQLVRQAVADMRNRRHSMRRRTMENLMSELMQDDASSLAPLSELSEADGMLLVSDSDSDAVSSARRGAAPQASSVSSDGEVRHGIA